MGPYPQRRVPQRGPDFRFLSLRCLTWTVNLWVKWSLRRRAVCVWSHAAVPRFFSQPAPAVSVLTLSQLVTFKLPSRATVGSALVSASSGVGHPPWVRFLSLGRFAQRNPCHVGLSSAEGDTWSLRTLRSFQPQAFVEVLLCHWSENPTFLRLCSGSVVGRTILGANRRADMRAWCRRTVPSNLRETASVGVR